MKKGFSKVLALVGISLVCIFYFHFNEVAFAQGTAIDKLVSPSGFSGQPLSKIINQLFFLGLLIAVVLAVIMIIRGGVEYMTTDAISGKENGKNRVKAALTGLLLAFSTILILNTINPNITDLKIKFSEIKKATPITITGLPAVPVSGGWYKDSGGNYVKVQSDGSKLVSQPDGTTFTLYPDGTRKPGFVPPAGQSAPLPPSGKTDTEIREYLKANGITVKPGGAEVADLPDKALIGLANLVDAAGTNIVVTGGSEEEGHKTHGAGKPIVDLRLNPTLDSYITNKSNNTTYVGNWPVYHHDDGTTYMHEGDHWHVVFH